MTTYNQLHTDNPQTDAAQELAESYVDPLEEEDEFWEEYDPREEEEETFFNPKSPSYYNWLSEYWSDLSIVDFG